MNTQRELATSGETAQSRGLRWTLGIALPLVAGTAFWWVPSLMGYADVMDDPTTGSVVLGLTVALAFAGGALLRSWWALLIVPAAWLVGQALTQVFMSLGTANLDWSALLPMSGSILLLVGLPLLFSAGLGVLVGQWLARRSAVHTASPTPPLSA